jgi:hypothetical protein
MKITNDDSIDYGPHRLKTTAAQNDLRRIAEDITVCLAPDAIYHSWKPSLDDMCLILDLLWAALRKRPNDRKKTP